MTDEERDREVVTADSLRETARLFEEGYYYLKHVPGLLNAAADALTQSEQRRVELEEGLRTLAYTFHLAHPPTHLTVARLKDCTHPTCVTARNLLSTHSKEEK